MGASGIETLKLLEDFIPNFIGIDLDPDNIIKYKSIYPNYQWHVANFFDIINKLDDVGVLNLDIYGNVGYDRDYADLLRIKSIIHKSINKFGEFILFYNKDLDGVLRQKQNPGKMLRYHSQKICDAFNNYLPNRKFDLYSLMPQGAEKEINDGFTGIIGAYEIYKGKSSGHRMANLRLLFK